MEKILELFEIAKDKDIQLSYLALKDLGFLVERHVQNRYNHENYRELFSVERDYLYDLKLNTEQVELIIHFLFFHIININSLPTTVLWCLSKCYGIEIKDGLKKILILYQDKDEVCFQLIQTINSLYDKDIFKNEFLDYLSDIIKLNKLEKSDEKLKEVKEAYSIL